MELPSSYNPKEAEDRWYRLWEEEGHFHAREDDGRAPYSIVIPPPNVTGSLHMGHALNNTLQDILSRWQRTGKIGLWMRNGPRGHATRVGSGKWEEKRTILREAFVKRVWMEGYYGG